MYVYTLFSLRTRMTPSNVSYHYSLSVPINQTMTKSEAGRLCSAMGIDLQIDIGDMAFDGAGTQEERCGDLAITCSSDDVLQDLRLACGQAAGAYRAVRWVRRIPRRVRPCVSKAVTDHCVAASCTDPSNTCSQRATLSCAITIASAIRCSISCHCWLDWQWVECWDAPLVRSGVGAPSPAQIMASQDGIDCIMTPSAAASMASR